MPFDLVVILVGWDEGHVIDDLILHAAAFLLFRAVQGVYHVASIVDAVEAEAVVLPDTHSVLALIALPRIRHLLLVQAICGILVALGSLGEIDDRGIGVQGRVHFVLV